MFRVELRSQDQPKLFDLTEQDCVPATACCSFLGLAAAALEAGGPFKVRWSSLKELAELVAKWNDLL